MSRRTIELQKANGNQGRFGELPQPVNTVDLENLPGTFALNDRTGLSSHAEAARRYTDDFEFGVALTVDANGQTRQPYGSCAVDELGIVEFDSDGQFGADAEAEWVRSCNRRGWQPVAGLTGQYAYNGAVMHPSEYLGGAMAERLAATPGTYAVVAVESFDPDGGDAEAIGWAIMRRIHRPGPIEERFADGAQTVIAGEVDFGRVSADDTFDISDVLAELDETDWEALESDPALIDQYIVRTFGTNEDDSRFYADSNWFEAAGHVR